MVRGDVAKGLGGGGGGLRGRGREVLVNGEVKKRVPQRSQSGRRGNGGLRETHGGKSQNEVDSKWWVMRDGSLEESGLAGPELPRVGQP